MFSVLCSFAEIVVHPGRWGKKRTKRQRRWSLLYYLYFVFLLCSVCSLIMWNGGCCGGDGGEQQNDTLTNCKMQQQKDIWCFFSHTTIEVNIVVDAITVGMDDEQRTNHKTRRSSDGLCLSSQAFRCRCIWPNDWIRIKGKPRTNKQHKNHRKQQQQPAAAEVS